MASPQKKNVSTPEFPDTFNYQDPIYHRVKDLVVERPKPDAEQVAKTTGVPQSVYLSYIKKELEDEDACLQLPMTILLLVSFSYLAIAHLGQNMVYAVEESIEFDISENANFAFAHAFGHKGIEDVNSVADFWSWMRLGYLPLIIQPSWSYSEAYPAALGDSVMKGTNYSTDDLTGSWLFPGYEKAAPVQNDYMRYHKLIGGIRMMQQVVPAETDACRSSSSMDVGSAFRSWFAKPCTPSGMAEMPPVLDETETFADITRTQWLLPEVDSLDDLKNVLLDMEDGCNFARESGAGLSTCRCTWCKKDKAQPWIDEETERVEVGFVVLNPAYGMYTYVGVNFFFNRGGHIYKFINSMSAWADPNVAPLSEQLPVWIADILWSGACLYVMKNEGAEIINLVRTSRTRWYKTIYDDYLGLWNIIDWVSIFVAMLIIQFYITMRFAVSTVNVQLTEMIQMSLQVPDRATYEAKVEEFFTLVQDMCSAEKVFRITLCIYPTIVMLRLFKSFKAQPRLALVTATMGKASQDMIHFFIVFLSVYVCMMVNSVLFFGQDVQEFGSPPRAIHACFRAMFGDWDWDAMKEIGFSKALIWFWLFMIIMVLLLLNMLLAIVMDAYNIVKSQAGDASTLLHQMREMKRRALQTRRGERVRLNEIYDVFLKDFGGDEKAMLADDKTLLKPEDVMDKINLPRKQATRTLSNALKGKWKAEEAKNTLDEEELKDKIKETLEYVEQRTHSIADDAAYVKERLSYWDRFQVPGDPEYDFHFGGDGSKKDADDLDLTTVVDNVSSDIGSMFMDNMNKIEKMQDSMQAQQDDLHKLISEMQMMVDQQVRCVNSISEDITAIGSPRRNEPEAPP
jgi:hypothetical protein